MNYRFGEAVLFALMANHIGEAIEAIREMFFFLGGGGIWVELIIRIC